MHQMLIFTALFGAALFITGCVINYRINRRRFNRNTFTGIQRYRNFEHKWSTGLVERVGKLIAILLIIFGLMIALGSILAPNFSK